jgi:hypothetical protein
MQGPLKVRGFARGRQDCNSAVQRAHRGIAKDSARAPLPRLTCPLSESHPSPAAVLRDKLDAGLFEGGLHFFQAAYAGILARLKTVDGVDAHARQLSEIGGC